MKNMTKHRDINLRTTEASRNYLVSKSNFFLAKPFLEYLISNRNEKNTDIHA